MSASRVVKKVPRTQAFRKDEGEAKLDESISEIKQSQPLALKTDEETKMVVDAFKSFDVDGDGFVSVREFVSMLNNYATDLTPKDIEEIVKESQLDVKGKMDYKEFVEFWKNIC